MDAKQACDKLNGFNFQNRYLVGQLGFLAAAGIPLREHDANRIYYVVLYHQPGKGNKSKEDLAERQENLEKLKREHGIE